MARMNARFTFTVPAAMKAEMKLVPINWSAFARDVIERRLKEERAEGKRRPKRSR